MDIDAYVLMQKDYVNQLMATGRAKLSIESGIETVQGQLDSFVPLLLPDKSPDELAAFRMITNPIVRDLLRHHVIAIEDREARILTELHAMASVWPLANKESVEEFVRAFTAVRLQYSKEANDATNPEPTLT